MTSLTVKHALPILMNCLEVTLSITTLNGLAALMFPGLNNNAVKSCRRCIHSAIKVSGYKLPSGRVTINCQYKEISLFGEHLNLLIAICLIAENESLNLRPIIQNECLVVGNLDINGTLLETKSITAIIEWAEKRGYKRIILPNANLEEATIAASTISPAGADCLRDVHNLLKNYNKYWPPKSLPKKQISKLTNQSLWQELFKTIDNRLVILGIIVALITREHCLIIGTPGLGKSLLLEQISMLMPTLTNDELAELGKVRSAYGAFSNSINRPCNFWRVNLETKELMGDKQNPFGMFCRNHLGSIMIDELTELNSLQLKILRELLTSENILLQNSVTKELASLPAECQFWAAMNPCPCGYHNHPDILCKCTSLTLQKFSTRMSANFLERFSIILRPEQKEQLSLHEEDELNKAIALDKKFSSRLNSVYKAYKKHFNNLSTTSIKKLTAKNLLQNYLKLVPKAQIKLNEYTRTNLRITTQLLRISCAIALLCNNKNITTAHLELARRVIGGIHKEFCN